MTGTDWTVTVCLFLAYAFGLGMGLWVAKGYWRRAADDWRTLAESLDSENEQLLDQVAELTDRLDHRARNLRSVR